MSFIGLTTKMRFFPELLLKYHANVCRKRIARHMIYLFNLLIKKLYISLKNFVLSYKK